MIFIVCGVLILSAIICTIIDKGFWNIVYYFKKFLRGK